MQLVLLRIHNYCSIANLEITLEDFAVLLGPNNCGKSNVLRALEFALSNTAKPDKGCFFEFRDKGDDELWVEATFTQLTPQEQKTFEKYVRADGTIRIRKTATLNGDAVDFGYRGYVQQPDAWWLRGDAFARLSTREQVEATIEQEGIDALRPLLQEKGRVTRQRVEDLQQAYIAIHRQAIRFTDELEEGPLFGTRNVAAGLLPEFFLIPAVQNVEDETRPKGTSTFSRLSQRAIRETALIGTRLDELRERMSSVVDELNARPDNAPGGASPLADLEAIMNKELQPWGASTSVQIDPIDVDKVFELSTRLVIDDGVPTGPERKGHGLQRAILFALIRLWAQQLRTGGAAPATIPRQASETVIFAIEEPELYLHPHAQRQLARALRDIAGQAEHQVIVCSHSAYFVSMEHYRSIVIVGKRDARVGTSVQQCREDLFAGEDDDDRRRRFNMAAWVNPDRGELFFAQRVVLVEGDTERVTLPFLADMLGCTNSAVSVIDCGSKQSMPVYITVLNAFSIQYVVIHDEDAEHDGCMCDIADPSLMPVGLNRRIAEAIRLDLGHLIVCRDGFEAVAGIPAPASKRANKNKPMKALEHFSLLRPKDLPQRLVDLVRRAYGAED